MTIQLIDSQEPPTEDAILYYSYRFQLLENFEHFKILYYTSFPRIHYFRLSDLYNCMVAEKKWEPMATERGAVASALDWISGYLGPNKMTREQLQNLPPEVIPFIYGDLNNTQLSC